MNLCLCLFQFTLIYLVLYSLHNNGFVLRGVRGGFKKIIDHVFGFQKVLLFLDVGKLGIVFTWWDDLPEILFQFIKIIQDFICYFASSGIEMALDQFL